MKENTDVLVVGAGVMGSATAYFLAKRGLSVLIVEKDTIASHASGFSFGMCNPVAGAGLPEPLLPLSLLANRMHEELAPELKELTGIDTSYRQMTHLHLAFSDDEAKELKRSLEWQENTGLGIRWLDASDVRAREPRVAGTVVGAIESPQMAMMDAYRFTLALAEGTERLGGRLIYQEVTGLGKDGEGFAVTLANGREMLAERVVLAMGPWSGQGPSDWLGLTVPVEPLKGQLLRLEIEGPPLECCLGRSGDYLGPKADGLVWAGTTEERVGFDENPTPQAQESIIEALLTIAPAFADARLSQQTACLRPMSEDTLPIVGEVPGWDGVFLATGAGRKGILLSTALGLAVCDLITEGKTEVPLDGISTQRLIA
jgi:glycine oxidase